jgi:hypothetical protein
VAAVPLVLSSHVQLQVPPPQALLGTSVWCMAVQPMMLLVAAGILLLVLLLLLLLLCGGALALPTAEPSCAVSSPLPP